MRKWLAWLIAAYILHTRPHPGRGFLGKIGWWLHPHPFVVETPDGLKRVILLNDVPTTVDSANDRVEIHRDPYVFCAHLREGMTVMDVGANVGIYALRMSRAIGQGGKVYAFEPVPSIFALLRENIALNNATNIIPVPMALADRKGTARMSVAGRGSSLFRHLSSQFVEVPLTTLDAFCEEEEIERVDAIKIDVEGAELTVIRGADEVLRRDRPLLMVEIQRATLEAAGTSPEELFATIVGYGYAPFVIRHGKAVPVNGLVEPWRYYWRYYWGDRLDNYLFLPREQV